MSGEFLYQSRGIRRLVGAGGDSLNVVGQKSPLENILLQTQESGINRRLIEQTHTICLMMTKGRKGKEPKERPKMQLSSYSTAQK